LVARVIENGDIHSDVLALDLLYAVFGFSKTKTKPNGFRVRIDLSIF
jgi:hypothetical protein